MNGSWVVELMWKTGKVQTSSMRGDGRAEVRTLGLEANQVQPWLCLISAPCPEADSVCSLHLLLHL